MGKDVEWSVTSLAWTAVLEFHKPRKLPVKTGGVPAEIRSMHPQTEVRSVKAYPLALHVPRNTNNKNWRSNYVHFYLSSFLQNKAKQKFRIEGQ